MAFARWPLYVVRSKRAGPPLSNSTAMNTSSTEVVGRKLRPAKHEGPNRHENAMECDVNSMFMADQLETVLENNTVPKAAAPDDAFRLCGSLSCLSNGRRIVRKKVRLRNYSANSYSEFHDIL